mgnify:CR=1 FL=1
MPVTTSLRSFSFTTAGAHCFASASSIWANAAKINIRFDGLTETEMGTRLARATQGIQSMRDIDRIANAMIANFSRIPAFDAIEASVRDFANAAKIKTETLRTDPGIFDVWSQLVTAGERLANFTPKQIPRSLGDAGGRPAHRVCDGLLLLRNGRDLVFYITRARTPMPKSTCEYIERCAAYLATGRVPVTPAPLPA